MDVKKLLYIFAAGTLFGFGGYATALDGYVTGGSNEVARDGMGGCVTTRFWSSDDAIAECHPQLVQRDEAAAFEEPRRRTEMISLEADTTFDFDEATLTDEGKEQLEQIAERAKDAQDPRIRIVGYTDQIGSESYNRELSERRARAVEEYLVEQGVSSEVIQTAARGESDPVVSCEGLQGDALIECLRPNRRSEVEFSAFEVIEEEPQQEQELQQEQNL